MQKTLIQVLMLAIFVCMPLSLHAQGEEAYTGEEAAQKDYFWDSYSRLLPYAAIGSMKIAGYDGRSSWARLAVSTVFSNAIMAASVYGAKGCINETRPDNTTENSFPSGHAATAFAAATILHKEYGLTRSPWFSIGGFAVATSTGVMRVMHNRHWAGDVAVGAGIGILSTELGYFLADLIFKDRGLCRQERYRDVNSDRPSFLDVQMGVGMHTGKITFGDTETPVALHLAASTVAGVEGAYFLNRHIGVGGMARVTSTPVKDIAISDNHFVDASLDCGVYGSLPIGNSCLLGAKALVGARLSEGISDNEKASMCIDVENSVNCVLGVSLAWQYKDQCAWKVFADYDITKKNYTLNASEYVDYNTSKAYSTTTTKRMDIICLGGSFTMYF